MQINSCRSRYIYGGRHLGVGISHTYRCRHGGGGGGIDEIDQIDGWMDGWGLGAYSYMSVDSWSSGIN